MNNPQTTEPDNPAAYALARHIADHPVSTIQAAFRYLNAPLEIELHEDPAPPVVRPELRDQIAEALIAWTYRGKGPEHGGILETVRANAYSRADAVMVVLRGLTLRELELLHRPNTLPSRPEPRPTPAEEAYRLALSQALRLGTGATWEAIRDRAEDLVAEVAELTEARATNRRLNLRAQGLESELAAYRRAVSQWEVSKRGTYVPLRTIAAIAKAAGRDIETPQWLLHYQRVEQAEAAIERVRRLHVPDENGECQDCGASFDPCPTIAALNQPAVVAAVAGEEPADETQTLAAMFEGLHTLLATSSRDWGTYRVDAWLWAVLCGWDCEQDEHDETCTHGALEEMQQQHGWDDEAVAKARRYRAAVRAIENRAAVSQPGKEA